VWVEVDEVHLFIRVHHRGHLVKGEEIWVIGGKFRSTGRIFIGRIPNKQHVNFVNVLRRNVEKETILVTDDHKSYKGVEKKLKFSTHEVLVHQYEFVNSTFPEVHTNGIEGCWAKMRKCIWTDGDDGKLVSSVMYNNSVFIFIT